MMLNNDEIRMPKSEKISKPESRSGRFGASSFVINSGFVILVSSLFVSFLLGRCTLAFQPGVFLQQVTVGHPRDVVAHGAMQTFRFDTSRG